MNNMCVSGLLSKASLYVLNSLIYTWQSQSVCVCVCVCADS